ncbi:membrane fusion protein [Duganella sp. 1224]|uniref:HlyD family secretion protein n=1 Tax=Duganella sp. 1224 TaxID=2587052 RepID=UPI00182A1F12|nr:HlyD family efflux transporter periplasmic adaptor subunit [Duganella sp. 1224]NYE61494.1 membrane fusion protein [Duganella sp. 1224]
MEALSASRITWLGEITLIRPLGLSVLSAIAVAFGILIAALLLFGCYTRRSTITGQLMSDLGVIKIHAPQSGIVLSKMVREGQAVHQGDVLYLVSSERQSANLGDVQQAITQQVALRTQSLRDELMHTRQLQQDEEAALHKKIGAMEAEQSNVAQQIASQRQRVELAERSLQRTTQLSEQGFFSQESTQQKQVDVLDQRQRLQILEREEINLRRDLQAAHSDLANLPLRHRNQIAQIDRQLSTTRQEWTESEARRYSAVTAPASGIATAITAEPGQAIDASQPIVSIIPDGARLQAHLYAPSRAVGFIRKNDRVLLRYQSFPFQKFGHAYGTVLSVSQSALSAKELNGVALVNNTGEPLYRVTVSLARQTMAAYGRPQPLHPGMQLEADVLLEQRKLYEWVLEPLYSVTGKL